MKLNLEARIMGETLVLNRSLDPFFEDYIELNDLNKLIELRRNQGNELMLIIKEGEIIMVNLPPQNNDPNVPEGVQAHAAPDGFAPQWIVTPLRATVTVSSEVGGPSTVAVEGPSFPLPAPGLPVPPTVIEDLSTHLGNLEYRHGVLMRKMKEVSDAEVADSIAIGEIHPRVATMEEQVESRVETYSSGQMAVRRQDVIVGLSLQVQTLQTALHGAELQNQQLRTRGAEMESCEGTMMSYMLWMEERLTVLEKRLSGPPPGPH
nr:hypothetical protein [Tanacetum cinerariifolium]